MGKKISLVMKLTIIFCFAESPGGLAVPKPSLQSALVQAGCKAARRTVLNPTQWEKEEFGMQVKQSVLTKCRAKDGYFHRFLVEEESYADEQAAMRRLPRIKEFPPELREKYGKGVGKAAVEYLLREGFRFYNKIYIVSVFTYALELDGDIHRLLSRIENILSK